MKTMRILLWIACIALLIRSATSCICLPFIPFCTVHDCGDTLGRGLIAICGCYTCSSGYYRTPGDICDDCPSKYSNCITCTPTTCLTCQSTYGVDTPGTCALCSSFNAGCYSCTLNTSPQKCLSCNSGFLMDSAIFRCVPCSYPLPNCMYCTNSTYCTLC